MEALPVLLPLPIEATKSKPPKIVARVIIPPSPRTLPSLAILLLAVGCGESPSMATKDSQTGAAPNVLLISLDTLRRDFVGAYNPKQTTTPSLDAFAKKSLQFEQAFTHHPWTLTAHATMLSGLYPTVHGVLSDRKMRDEVTLMPEIFQDAGYATVGVVDQCMWVNPRFGFSQGFGNYLVVAKPAGPKVDTLLAQIDSVGGQPFFGFLHLFDAHSDAEKLPYDSAPAYMEEYAGWYKGDFDGTLEEHPEWGHSSALLIRMNEEGAVLEGDDARYLEDLYRAGIRTMDEQLGRLLTELEQRGLLENTVIAIVSDHGESFYEHGLSLHEGQYDELLRVPFLIRAPCAAAGTTEEPVGLVDLAPTLLELAGLNKHADMQGRSLAPLLHGTGFAESSDYVLLDNSMFLGLRSQTQAAIWGPEGVGVYDMQNDPEQRTNLAEDQAWAPRVAELAKWSQAQYQTMEELRSRLAALPGTVEISASDGADLHAIGYTGE